MRDAARLFLVCALAALAAVAPVALAFWLGGPG